MIHKVKPPTILKLVQSSKESKNDLGGQSGEAYSKEQKQPPAKPDVPALSPVAEAEPGAGESKPTESASISEQVGLTQVVKDWHEGNKPSGTISRYKLSLKYQGESAPAKGMLLNKKIS